MSTRNFPQLLACGLVTLLGPVLLLAGCNSSGGGDDATASKPTHNDSIETTATSAPGLGPETVTSKDAGSSDAETETQPQQSQTRRADIPLFKDWPKPRLALLISGQQHGYVEPCGCTGLDNQKGGLARRHTLARQLVDRGIPLLPIDAGNQVRRVGRQAELKFQMTSEGLRKIGYEAVGLGVDDLLLSVGELVAITAPTDGEGRFICANAAILDREWTPMYRVVNVGDYEVGITSVIGKKPLERIRSDEIVKRDAEEALTEVLEAFDKAHCQLRILMVQASLQESRELARKFPQFDIVVSAGSLGDPPYQPEQIEGSDTLFVETGVKGMFTGVIGVFDEGTRFRYQRVPMDARFKDSQQMLSLLSAYQDQLQQTGFDGLGLRPIPHSSGASYVGSEKCGDCHTSAFDVWVNTPHSHATDSLVHPGERSEIPRHFDPECLSCHVTGWNAARFYPYETGYLSLKQSAHLLGNGCENCHGPGSQHVAAEEGEIDADDEEIALLRNSMRLPLARAELSCQVCHDLDNDPDFHEEGAFLKYWELIKHYGLD